MKNLKKKIPLFGLALLTALSMTGCGKKIQTELPMENIQSMITNAYGDLYLLTDNGIRYYALTGDKEVDYIHGSDELSEAEINWIDRGEEVSYSGLKIDRLMAAGEDGVTMLGRYMNNNSGRNSDLYVIQDAADLNYGAGYQIEIERASKAKTSVLNGACVTSGGVYLKLNRAAERFPKFSDGISVSFDGAVSAYPMPDDVTAAVQRDGKMYFLTENKIEIAVISDGEALQTFDRAGVADAFVSGGEIYIVYKSGRVTKWSEGGEEDFMDLGTKLGDVNDALLIDGQLYWFDAEGVKTAKAK